MPYTKAQAKEKITKLVEDFRAHERTLERAPEAEIENSFIRPLFEALNWNTTNQGLSYAHYEFKVQATNKKGLRPDYVLHLDGRDLLVMDAKQVHHSMKDPRWLYQVYSYAYSTQNSKPSEKIDFAILTDFQEFIVLDCTLYAAKPEAVNNFRVIDWKYTDYVEQFDTLWDLFERQNVLNASRSHLGRGAVSAPNDKTTAPDDKSNTPKESLDHVVARSEVPKQSPDKEEVASAKSKNSLATTSHGLWGMYLSPQKVKANRIAPDKAFLAQMDDEKDGWRVLLAKDMKKRNPRADGELITAAVQLLIDRLIFIKALSDREVDRDYLSEIESRVVEAGLGENEAGWFASCKSIFDELNNFYNGSIFEPRPELENVSVGNRAVESVLHDLQPENSPYNFAVLPVEILGTIYERFLGRVVRTTEKRVTIEDKPEVRKAGGVYYTPQYIVDYIVENTLGKLLADCKTPADVAKLKILDPSCGSGSFLLGAYSKLIDWHKDYYARAGKDKRDRASFYRDEGGLIRLTAKLKRDILKNNLYGVDIDPQAVEVTRFSLSLKALEDLREGELTEERTLFHQTVLPDLSENIKNGNSLIGTDYFTGQMFTDNEEMKNVRPFDWSHEFKEIMSAGGFDCVIGNPPWGGELTFDEKDYLIKRFANVHMRTPDTFNYLMANSYELISVDGIAGMIIPNNFLFQHEYAKARKFYIQNTKLLEAINLGDGVFDVTAPSCIVIFERTTAAGDYDIYVSDLRNIDRSVLNEALTNHSGVTINSTDIMESPDSIIPMNKISSRLISKILKNAPTLLGDICDEVAAGIGTGGDKIFRLSDADAKKHKIERDLLHPVLVGRDIQAYYLPKQTGHSIIYSTKEISSKTHPKALDYLKPFQEKLSQKRETQKGLIPWWSLHWPRYPELFDAPKIILRQTANSLYATLDDIGYYCLNSIIIVRPKNMELILFYLGLLNSQLLRWVYQNLTQEENRAFAEVKPVNLRKLPIRTLDLNKPDEKAQHDKMVALVEQMLSLHKSKAEAQTQAGADAYERQIRAIDSAIDTLVYQLYGLTPEEVKIVEG